MIDIATVLELYRAYRKAEKAVIMDGDLREETDLIEYGKRSSDPFFDGEPEMNRN